MKAKLFTILFVVLLMLQIASAEIVVNKMVCNFDLSSSHIDRKVCSGSETIVPVTIDNVGDVEALFELQLISEQEDWFTLEKKGFLLKPGQSEVAFMRVNIPFGFTGFVDYTIKAMTREFGREKFIERSFEVVNCQNIQVEGPGSDVICPAELSTTSFVVSNPAPFADHYMISANEYSDFVTFSESEFTLAPGDEKEVFVYTKFSADMYGDFNIPVDIMTESNEMVKDINVKVKVKKAYEFGVEVEPYAFACSDIEKQIPITISNNKVACDQHEGVENVYDIKLLNAPDSVELTHTAVKLSPGESTTIFANVNPSENDIGVVDMELVVESRLGDLAATRQIKLDVGDCYRHTLDVPEKAVMICDENTLDSETFNVNVKNVGLHKEDVVVTLVAESWASLDQRNVHLNENENANLGLIVNPPCTDQTYDLLVKSRDTQIESGNEDTMELQVVTPRTAFLLKLLQHNFDLKYDAETLEVPVRHVGVRASTYKVSLDSTFLTPVKDMIKLEPGETKMVIFDVGDVSGLEPGEYLHGLTFVEQSRGVVYETGIGTNLIGPSFLQRTWGWLMNKLVHSKWYSKIGWCGWSGILLLLVLVGILVFNSLCREGRVKTKRFTKEYKTNFKVLNLALLLLVVVALVYSLGTFSTARPEFFAPAIVTNDLLTIQFGEDTTETLNLDKYFVDPDNDKLVYNSVGTEHVEVLIDENMAMLTPDEGWFGEEKAAFIATDEAGADATSKLFTLRVLERKDLSWVDYWLGNCTQVNAFVIALIFLALMFLADQVAPKGRDYYFGETKPKKAAKKPAAKKAKKATRKPAVKKKAVRRKKR